MREFKRTTPHDGTWMEAAAMEDESELVALVRYGVMGHVGEFRVETGLDPALERGQQVVIQSDRGIELGEVLLRLDPPELQPPDPDRVRARLLRVAGTEELASFRRSEQLCAERLGQCLEILEQGGWPVELLDVEPLLGADTIVLHCLCLDDFEPSVLRARFRAECGFDVLFEPLNPAFPQPPATDVEARPPSSTKSKCGDCDCAGSGCGSKKASQPGLETGSEVDHGARGGCGTQSHQGCSSCGISKWHSAGAGATSHEAHRR